MSNAGSSAEIEVAMISKFISTVFMFLNAVPFPPKTTNYTPLVPPEDIIPSRPFNCGALIMGKLNGTVSTPAFPQYEPNISCSWQIIAPEGYRLKINITSYGLKEIYRYAATYEEKISHK